MEGEGLSTAARKTRVTFEMIKFSHTIFALPFALLSAFLAAGGTPAPWTLAWILGAMVGARSAAMAFNRLVDAAFDARNPRTEGRALPAGDVDRGYVVMFTLASVGLFVVSAAMLNPLCLALSPAALAVILGYSFTKRFTAGSHFVLRLGLGIAPAGAWIAVTGGLTLLPVVLSGVVMLWTAGFDVIYACQDVDIDRREGLHSIPARLGVAPALWLSRFLHGVVVLVLAALPVLEPRFGWIYGCGVGIVVAVLFYEHHLVRANDLSRVDAAFFTMNGIVSVVLAASVIAEVVQP